MNQIELYIQQYAARLFPLRMLKEKGDPSAKRPLSDGWNVKKYSQAKLLEYANKGHGLGWALGPEDLVIDVDYPTEDRPNKIGHLSKEKLENLLGASLGSVAVEVVAPSGGRHYYLKKPANLKVRKKHPDFPDIEFLSEGMYVVIAGSRHWQGGRYRFGEMIELSQDYDRNPIPKVLIDFIQKKSKTNTEHAPSIDGSSLELMLSQLDPVAYRDHDDWMEILFASHHATGGSDEGLNAFLEWSTSDPRYAGDSEVISDRWASLKAVEGGITIATLFGQLIDLGYGDVVERVKVAAEFDFIENDIADVEPDGENKVPIEYTNDDWEVNKLVIAQLATIGNLFQRSGMLVKIRETDIVTLKPLGICEQVSTVCELGTFKNTKKGEKWEPMRVPERIGKQIHEHGAWFGVRKLKGITTIPVLTENGVLQKPGYDIASKMFYVKTIDIPKIHKPTIDDAVAAAELIFDLVVDFPFADNAHRSAWLASFLVVLARPAISGAVPFNFVDGSQSGVGKGLLNDLTSIMLFGKVLSNQPGMPDTEAEMQKTLVSIAMRNSPTHSFDNLPNGAKIGSPSFDSVLTGSSVTGRILGRTEIRDFEIDTVFFGTGNRVSLNKESDILRRLNYINLISNVERSENRTGFKHGDSAQIKKYARVNRAKFVHAGLTILEAARNFRHVEPLAAWGSYDSFSEIVRKAIVMIGEPDPLLTRASIEERDDSVGELKTVVRALELLGCESIETGKTARGIIEAIDSYDDEYETDSANPMEAARDVLAPRGYANRSVACGKRLTTRFRAQVVGGKRIVQRKNRKDVNVFWVETLESELKEKDEFEIPI